MKAQNRTTNLVLSAVAGAAIVLLLSAAQGNSAKTWEYQTMDYRHQGDLIQGLNRAGQEGWEAAFVVKPSEEGAPVIVMKRTKP
jgi:hypothetical protein